MAKRKSGKAKRKSTAKRRTKKKGTGLFTRLSNLERGQASLENRMGDVEKEQKFQLNLIGQVAGVVRNMGAKGRNAARRAKASKKTRLRAA